IVDILDAPPAPEVEVSPARNLLLLLERRSMPPLEELAQPMLQLAGHRINPRTNGQHHTPGITGISLQPVRGGAPREVQLPEGASLLPIGFSPNGASYAFGLVGEREVALWLLDVQAASARRVEGVALNATMDDPPCHWLDDSSALVCLTVPADRGKPPTPPLVPSAPNVQESRGKTAPVRTYQDLLHDAQDEATFAYYFTSRVAYVNRSTRDVLPVGTRGIYGRATPSPDSKYLLVERHKEPFSRLLPLDGFPKEIQIWSRAADAVRTIADLPSEEGVPLTGVPVGPREVRWQPTEPARLVWAEALDEGDLENEVPHRDKLMALAAPFTSEPIEWHRTEHRFTSIAWTDDGAAMIREFHRPTRHVRTWIVGSAEAEPRQVWDLSQHDRYRDPGEPVERLAARTILQDGNAIYLTGDGASPEGDRPFLDRLDLQTLKTTRLFQADDNSYESVVALLGDDGSEVITRYETRTDYPNYFVRQPKTGDRRAVTSFTDPYPQLAGATKQLVTYTRKDGVQLSGTLYLPPNHKKGTRIPMLMWAYPREYVDPKIASQVSGSPHRFVQMSGASHLLLLTQGYAIFDSPTMPIVGPGETANDHYVEQLVASAEAAVEKVVSMGVTDRERIGLGGHSYGAFMTANLLAHSDVFRAGIARSGAYNRTLTPFGFQAERRTFWEVSDVYAQMSPFWHAHQIKEPVLIVHGEADDNSGTFPIQSERLYMAIKGHGGTVRYVTLPHEAHRYEARESVLHVVAEMLNWMDEHVKQATPRPTSTVEAGVAR
ncbi:MAG: alpha/beta hydrolase family protein, partial [Vicinamibacteraceae bacterium]